MSVVSPRARVSLAVRAVIVCLFAAGAATHHQAQGLSYFAPTDSLGAALPSPAAAALQDGSVLVVGAGAAAAAIYEPATGRFLNSAQMLEARTDATALELADGRVLVVGGRNGTAALASSEVFDPATGAFNAAGSLAVPRAHAALARLLDGRVLIAGGSDGEGALASAELYDAASGTYAPVGRMQQARIGTAATLADGRVLVLGGPAADALSDSAELYDPDAGGFTRRAALNIPRSGYVATALADGRVIVTGGMDAAGALVSESEIYDPVSASFRLAGRLVTPRQGHSAVLLQDGTVLVVGGRNASGILTCTETYDPQAGRYGSDAPLNEPRLAPMAVALADGGALVAGGEGLDAATPATAERYFRRRADTTATITSSAPASTYGQLVKYTAAVTSAAATPAGTVQFLDGATVLGEAPLDTAGRAVLNTTATAAGSRSIVAQYTGSAAFNPSVSRSIQQSVAQASATGTFTIGPLQRQYSDPVTFTATISPATAAQSVTFSLGAATIGTAPVVGGKATLTTPVLATMPPGSRMITAVFNQTTPNYAVASIAKSMSIVKEDARITGYGKTAFTICRTCTTAKLSLELYVKDISVTADAAGDVTPGDIRNATVAFINRSTSATIATVPVVLSDPKVTTSGEAEYEWTVDMGSASSKTFYIGYQVGGLYTRASYDYYTVTVSRSK